MDQVWTSFGIHIYTILYYVYDLFMNMSMGITNMYTNILYTVYCILYTVYNILSAVIMRTWHDDAE